MDLPREVGSNPTVSANFKIKINMFILFLCTLILGMIFILVKKEDEDDDLF